MFSNANNGYSLADIAAATGGNRNDMWGGDNGAWWIIILFLFAFAGGWGNGGGFSPFGCGGAATGSGITDGYILTSDFANIERKIDGVNNGLCDGFYAMNTGILNGFAGVNNSITQQTIAEMQNTNAIGAQITALGTQQASCCCDINNNLTRNFADLNYNLATQQCQTRQAVADAKSIIVANQDANTRAILDFLTQDKISTLTAENQSLKFAASQAAQNTYLINALQPAPRPAYVVANPYASINYNTCGCGYCS